MAHLDEDDGLLIIKNLQRHKIRLSIHASLKVIFIFIGDLLPTLLLRHEPMELLLSLTTRFRASLDRVA